MEDKKVKNGMHDGGRKNASSEQEKAKKGAEHTHEMEREAGEGKKKTTSECGCKYF